MVHNHIAKGNGAVKRFGRALDLEELVSLQGQSHKYEEHLGESIAGSHHGILGKTKKRKNEMQSLRTILARSLAHNVAAIPLEVLKQIQWVHAQMIWKIICDEMLDTLEVVAKFAVAFPNDLSTVKAVHCSTEQLPMILESITSMSLRSDFSQNVPGVKQAWLLSLDLSHIPINEEILLQLGAIPGLVSLTVNDAGITDEIIKHWSRAESVGRFSCLKFIDIRANGAGIKNLPQTLELLLRFKSLEIIQSDYIDSYIYKTTEEEALAMKTRWSSARFDEKQTVVAVTAHLGSRADRRPISSFLESMMVDVKVSRARLLQDTTVVTQHERPDILSRRKQKKLRQLQQAGTDIWKNGY